MRSLVFILPALFVAALAAPNGGYSRSNSNNGGGANNVGSPQIIPSGNGAGGYSRGGTYHAAGAAQANAGAGNGNLDDGQQVAAAQGADQSGAAAQGADQTGAGAGGRSVSTNNGVAVQGGAPVIVPGAGGAGGYSNNNNNGGIGAGYGAAGGAGGSSNVNNGGLGGSGGAVNNGGGAGGNSNSNQGGGAGAYPQGGSPFAHPGDHGADGHSNAGGSVNHALLSNQALTDGGGMSAGAIAGVAVGVLAVAALGTAIAVIVLRR